MRLLSLGVLFALLVALSTGSLIALSGREQLESRIQRSVRELESELAAARAFAGDRGQQSRNALPGSDLLEIALPTAADIAKETETAQETRQQIVARATTSRQATELLSEWQEQRAERAEADFESLYFSVDQLLARAGVVNERTTADEAGLSLYSDLLRCGFPLGCTTSANKIAAELSKLGASVRALYLNSTEERQRRSIKKPKPIDEGGMNQGDPDYRRIRSDSASLAASIRALRQALKTSHDCIQDLRLELTQIAPSDKVRELSILRDCGRKVQNLRGAGSGVGYSTADLALAVSEASTAKPGRARCFADEINVVPEHWINSVNPQQYSSDLLLSALLISTGTLGALIYALRNSGNRSDQEPARALMRSLLLGSSAGFIVFLAVQGGIQALLVQTDGTQVSLNSHAAALVGLLAGMYTERFFDVVNRLTEGAIDHVGKGREERE